MVMPKKKKIGVSPLQWLETLWKGPNPTDAVIPGIPGADNSPLLNLHVFAALVGLNQFHTNVSIWGKTEAGGLYHRVGLTQEEALALISLSSYVKGLNDAYGMEPIFVLKRLKAEWDRVFAYNKPRIVVPSVFQ